MPNFRESSRKEWESTASIVHVNAGSLQRIADATELMARQLMELIREREDHERQLPAAPTTEAAPKPAVQQGDDFWPVDGNASRKQLIKQIGQMNYRLTALRQQNAGLVARVQRQAEALRNLQSAAALAAQGEPLTDTYIQQVPDKCDRIVWRGSYYHLPINSASAAEEGSQP